MRYAFTFYTDRVAKLTGRKVLPFPKKKAKGPGGGREVIAFVEANSLEQAAWQLLLTFDPKTDANKKDAVRIANEYFEVGFVEELWTIGANSQVHVEQLGVK